MRYSALLISILVVCLKNRDGDVGRLYGVIDLSTILSTLRVGAFTPDSTLCDAAVTVFDSTSQVYGDAIDMCERLKVMVCEDLAVGDVGAIIYMGISAYVHEF